MLAYPDLKLEVEGHTDSTGSHEFNQRLSEKRAASVRDYLVDANVPVNNVMARGLAETDPVADNKTAAGRKLNRRVEMIVSGDVIGTGTPAGVGFARKPPRFLKVGDVVIVRVEGLGELRNPVEAENVE